MQNPPPSVRPDAAAALTILELRRYVTHPGKRDALIALFESHFIESQEACGMLPVGHFRDLGDPDSFVWLRLFSDMESRPKALEQFYLKSAAWREHRTAANATMIDSDNVLLLRKAREASGIDARGLTRPGVGQDETASSSYVGVAVHMTDSSSWEDALRAFEESILPRLTQVADRVGYFVTEQSPNNFPQLPVRESENAIVAIGSCRDLDALAEWQHAFPSEGWERLHLEPARRSLYR